MSEWYILLCCDLDLAGICFSMNSAANVSFFKIYKPIVFDQERLAELYGCRDDIAVLYSSIIVI